MNLTSIEYCHYTLNPITGCLNDCGYCYARRIATRFKASKAFPNGFQPTFHPERLNEPYRLKKPSIILLCSMGDMFGWWVPDEWILKTFEMIEQNPKHIFIILTKCSYGLKKWNFKDLKNLWLGVSIDGLNPDLDYIRLLHLKDTNARTKIVSIEPLLKPVKLSLRGIKWVIIGGQTNPTRVPEKEWIEEILKEAALYGISVFIKDNAGWPEKMQFYPYQSQWKTQWEGEYPVWRT